MYKIFADGILIYDSTLDDYKIERGSVTLETNKAGSFVFSVYPDHFYYDKFVKMKTVISVYRSDKIIFRGRVLNDVVDYHNNKVLTCEGELSFLQDSIIRPYTFSGTITDYFSNLITEHNNQVDEFKRFKIGLVTVTDNNDYITRSNGDYETALENLNKRLIENASTGGYLYITHVDNEEIPTINYISDFTNISTQKIEFGTNLRDYVKTTNGASIKTAIIPLGAEIEDNNEAMVNQRLTIANINDGLDYVYSVEGVALYGWIFEVVEWDDVTDIYNLKRKADKYITTSVNQNVTLELTAIDLHLIDKSIDSINVGDYVRIISEPHNFDSVLLCNKQTINLLKPENDTLILGYTYATFTGSSNQQITPNVTVIKSAVKEVTNQITQINQRVEETNNTTAEIIIRLEQLEQGGSGGGDSPNYDDLNSEEWIFTFEDGTVMTKNIVIDKQLDGEEWVLTFTDDTTATKKVAILS